VVFGTPFSCVADPSVTPEFVADQTAANNRVVDNVLVNNGTNPAPGPFEDVAADISLVTLGDHGNCFAANLFTTFYSIIGVLPECE
jgi:hypothetical protein